MHFETRCVHVGVDKDSAYKSCITPIYPSSTFAWDDLQTNRGYDYTRSGNPTRKALEENIASLEGGIDCKATSTGMSAITAALHLFQPGDHIIAGHDIYGGTYRLFADVYAKWGFKFSFVNMGDPENVRKAITPATKGIWIETPSNPLLNLVDLAAVSKIARDAGLVTIADNTFLSPYLQRPFEFGVDVVDALDDEVSQRPFRRCRRLRRHAAQTACRAGGLYRQRAGRRLFAIRRLVGAAGSQNARPADASARTGAQAVAKMLEGHPAVDRVYYPGLASHPHHELARRQQKGFGGMVSFDVRGGRADAERFLYGTKLFQLAESLGGIESLVAFPVTMSHASMSAEARQKAGISERTIRLSVGIEHPDDLIADLRHALGS